MIVSMKNDAGLVRQVKVGFCWTALFFGPLPFFFRGMAQNGLIWCCLPVIGNFVLPFRMNKYTAHYYLEHGYKPIGKGWNTAAPLWGVALPSTGEQHEVADVLGRDEQPSDTKFKFKTWHKVVAGLLVVGAIFGNHKKEPAAPEPEPKSEVIAATNVVAPPPVATPTPKPELVTPVIATPASNVEPVRTESAAAVVSSVAEHVDVPAKSNSEAPAAPTTAVAQTWMPSFDCAKASNGPERLVCSSRELSAADVKLGQAYKWALSNTIDKGVALKKRQNEWRKNERDACSDVSCMLKAYQKRIDELGA